MVNIINPDGSTIQFNSFYKKLQQLFGDLELLTEDGKKILAKDKILKLFFIKIDSPTLDPRSVKSLQKGGNIRQLQEFLTGFEGIKDNEKIKAIKLADTIIDFNRLILYINRFKKKVPRSKKTSLQPITEGSEKEEQGLLKKRAPISWNQEMSKKFHKPRSLVLPPQKKLSEKEQYKLNKIWQFKEPKPKKVTKESFEEHLKQIGWLIEDNNFVEAKNRIEALKSEVNNAQHLLEHDFSDIETKAGNLLIDIGKREKEYYNENEIDKEEINTLKEFEKMIGKSIPLIKEIKNPWEKFNEMQGSPGSSIKFGAKVENNKIVYLHLKECGLKKIPNSIDKLKSLRRLILRFNYIKELPKEIGNLKELEEIDIENKGTQRTRILSDKPFLKDIKYKEKKCDYCLESIPESIGELENLKKLNLSGNNLLNLPVSFNKLKKLEYLNLNSNQFEALPEIFRGLKDLKILSLESNILTQLPDSIGDLKNLEELYLISNQIEVLPKTFGGLENLKILDLRGNNLSSLPSSFGKLKMLNFLDLGKNRFKSIPGELWSLDTLEKLDLEDNPFVGKSEALLKEYPERNPYQPYNRFIKQRDISVIKEFCRKNVAISIFISHTVVDYKKYMIKEFSEFLERQTEIYNAYFCEQDLIGNIDDFMNQTIPLCQLLIFFATKKSIYNSIDCRHELELARKLNIQVILIKGDDVNWEELDTLNLNREYGFDFREFSFKEFCNRIYEYIKEYKRKINLFNGRELHFKRIKSKVSYNNEGLDEQKNDIIKILDKLDIRLANGEISEEIYKKLTKKWDEKLETFKTK